MNAITNVVRRWSAAILVATLFTSTAHTQDLEAAKKALRMDALRIMGAGLKVPGVAAYCEKNIESNPALIEAARAWNERHRGLLQRAIRAIEWSGGMSGAERELYDRLALRLLKSEFEDEPNRVAHCRDVLAAIRAGDMDLERSPITAEAAQRIMSANFK